tara:strand:+ start:1774 stop:3735 length:1962 start_codon:yes stop_codon:yes gene_type:complete
MKQSLEILWSPDSEFIENSNLKNFEIWLKNNKGLTFRNYFELWKWSIDDVESFWKNIWEYFEIISYSDFSSVLSDDKMPEAKWFQGASLNYIEHIFRHKNDDNPAFYFKNEISPLASISWKELEERAANLQNFMLAHGIKKGDCIAGYIPNIPEAIVIFMAASSIGAVWTCVSSEFGAKTVVERFALVKPRLLFFSDGYHYNGKANSRVKEVIQIQREISSIEKVILISCLSNDIPPLENLLVWEDVSKGDFTSLEFIPVEFEHPIWILYSSGTTGKPKAITHSHGGVLLEHLKYLSFHNNVKPGEVFFWFTTTGWMMWNFLPASMLIGAIPLLFDGSPSYPNLTALWSLASELPIHHFGTSAPFLIACMKRNVKPGANFDLSFLQSISSTGAPLPPEVFDWVYENVKEDIWLCSMSGGTDVCTAFVGGCPTEAVYKGLIQVRALGCALFAYDEAGNRIFGNLGEMVIEKPMPSMPIYFWNDPGNQLYKSSYFNYFKNKWCHGDWVNILENGGVMIQGRSDATLNRKGIRIGTAEIYAVLDHIEGIKDSLVVNIEKPNGDDVMPLFIVTEDNVVTSKIFKIIRATLKEQCSPRHVPDQIYKVSDIPYTINGKKMEVPVKKALMGMGNEINLETMRNPEALEIILKTYHETNLI